MTNPPVCRIPYKRSRFSTQLPTDRRYSASHFWLLEVEPSLWRIGFTRFATRMLGDLVEFGFEVKPGDSVELGQTVGWIEAFKAMTDLYCPGSGTFAGGNLALEKEPALFDKDPYGAGWLYLLRGEPDPGTVDAAAYTATLDAAIDKILGKNPDAGNDLSEGEA